MRPEQRTDTSDEPAPRLLIVDDEAWIRNYLQEFAVEWGYTVSTADTVNTARSLLEERDFDLAILDLFLRDEIGLTVLDLARRVRSSPEVIVITGRGDTAHAVEALSLGAFDYLKKPLDAERLRLTIRRALELRRLKAEVARLSGNGSHPYTAHVTASSLAFHDSVTGLPNRVLFFDRLHQAILSLPADGWSLALILVSVSGLRRAGLAYGFQHADEVLSAIAKNLREIVFRRDTVSRTGGSEFAIIAEINAPDKIMILLNKISDSFESLHVGRRLVERIGLYIGIALFPADADTAENLYQRASIALDMQQHRKQAGYQFYEEERGKNVQRAVRLERQLARGLQEDRFSIVLQPYHRVADGSIHGAEALLRWTDSDGTQVSPFEFIPILENSGAIVVVTEWIITQLAQLQARLLEDGFDNQWLSFNVSPVHLRRIDDTKRLVALIMDSFRRPSQVVVEVTEGEALEESRVTDTAIAIFREARTPLAVDDFGTGYSSLSYLSRYRFDYLKIDRSFVEKVDTRADSHAIVAAIVSMAHQLGIATVAEGVENEAQLEIMRTFGCDIVQGYYYSRPLSSQSFLDYTREMRAKR